MPVLAGDVYPATYTAPVDYLAGATIKLTVTAPDGTITTPAVTPDPATAGRATATVLAPIPGDYLLVWTASGAFVDVEQDQFTAIAPAIQLLNLSDLVDHLSVRPDRELQAKLRRWITAAANVVENVCGPVLPKPRTDYFDGGIESIVLPFRWVRSITSITEIIGTTAYPLTEQPLGASLNGYGYTWDRTINQIVRRGAGGEAMPFAGDAQAVAVKYVLGLPAVPTDIQMGATELVAHWYRRDEAPGRRSGFPGDEVAETTVAGYLVPRAVMEVLKPWARRPGIF